MSAPSASQAPSGGRRWWRRAAWAVGSLLLLWLLLWLAAPPLLKWQLQKQGSAALGRVVTVDAVEVQPWSLAVRLTGLRVAGADGQSEQFALRSLYMNAELQSLLRWAPVFDALRIEGPSLSLRHLGGGRWDIDDVLQRLRATPEEPSQADAAFPRLSIFNIELLEGQVVLVDEAVGVRHALEGLHLSIPFLSNLGARREVVTQPRLAFVLNGSAFDSSASTTPFAEDHRTQARLQIPALDLQPYLPYWPQAWPLRLEAGQLHVDLTADFEQTDEPTVVLAGSVGLSTFRAVDVSQGDQVRPLLAWDRLDLGIERAEPLRQQLRLGELRLVGPRAHIQRDARGQLALARIAAAMVPAASTAPADPPASPAAPWRVQLKRLTLEAGQVAWADASVQPAAAITLADLRLAATDIAWPVAQAVPFELEGRVGDAPLRLSGSATDAEAQAKASLGALPLSLAASYLSPWLQPSLDGQLKAEAEWRWRRDTPDRPAELRLLGGQLELTDLRLGPERDALARLRRLAVEDAEVDLLARRVDVGRVSLEAARATVARDAQGRFEAESWFKTPATASAPAAAAGPAWAVRIADLQLQGARLQWKDASPAQPVSLLLDRLSLSVQNLQPLAPKPVDTRVKLQLRMAAAEGQGGEAGTLSVDGNVRLPAGGQGLGVRTQVRAERLPVHALEPYVGERLNLDLLRADASYTGSLNLDQRPNGMRLSLAGDAALENLQAQTLAPAEELLNWTSLQVRGLQVDMAPEQALRVAVSETVLSDWFARIIIDPEGRINLQGLVKPAPPEPAAVASAAPAPAPPPDIQVGPISLINGRVLFSDRFIKPNYSATLTELNGTLSAFSSTAPAAGQAPELAQLSLKGRAEGTASLDVNGRINPLAKPLALDIKGAVRNLELPPLSPYSVKYAGYGIQRGKLSVDVAYQIAPDGRLTASNQLILNQLSFGDRVEGSSAPNLPVKLAVALLADRDGVIDINLPVSGSLNDPQFRLGPIIVRLVVNLIGKAITAPFALIANAFSGGGVDASQIAFEPGRAVLSEAARQQLDNVAKALQNRPALRLTVIGHSDLATERNAMQRARLDALVLAEKRRALARSGAAVPDALTVSAEEYPALLREVYRRADIPKPRNLIGIAKDIPQADMEALLLAAQPVNADAMRELAVARGIAVKDHLASRQLAEDRMFLGAPNTASGVADRQPKAELQLAPR